MNEKVNKENALKFISEFSYFRLLYNEPRGEIGDLIHKIGGDIKANFDRSKYRKLINKLCSEKKFLSRREVIVFSMGAYAECRGFDVKKIKYIGLNDAVSLRGEDLLKGYSSQHLKQANKDFPNIIYLALLRDPRAQFASTRHQMINEFGNNYKLKMGNWWSSLENLIFNRISLDDGPAHFCLLYQVAAFKALVSIWRESQAKWLFVKNENINTKFLPTMTALCNKLSINPDQAWVRDGDEFKPTMLGQPWAGTGAYSSRYQNIKTGPLENDPQKTILKAIGPNSYVIRRWKSRLPTAEKYLLEKFFQLEIKLFSYPVFFKEKNILKTIFYSFYPFLGEWPSLSWLRSSENKLDLLNRIFYTATLWPFYLLSRWKLWQYERKGYLFKDEIDGLEITMVK